MLQTRTGKCTGPAGVKIACDMVKEGTIDEREALLRVPAGDLTQLLLPTFTDESKKDADVLATGLPASPRRSKLTRWGSNRKPTRMFPPGCPPSWRAVGGISTQL